MRDNFIRRISFDCPICNKFHEVEERRRMTSILIKGEEVEYEESYYLCHNTDEEENEFATAKMENENLLHARNEYRRRHNLLTSDEIVGIRERYGLSQIDLAKLLGWGEATISRYESKAIQDEAYDNMLRIIKDNPLRAYKFLQRNHEKFTTDKNLEIRKRITFNLNEYGIEYLKRQALESEYINFMEPSEENGYQLLNIDKIESVVSYFANVVDNLYKVKLMKLLWYADVLCFKETGRAMTGLVYCHESMGALPIGHYKIVDLENINVVEEEGYEYTKYHFMPNKYMDNSFLEKKEKDILDLVIAKFMNFSSADIVKYMHEETAYKNTKSGEIIKFTLASSIRDF